jgi:tetratricopeptide (TPR) repeat protein
LNDPGPQLSEVIEFKRKIESGKKYFWRSYAETSDFGEDLEQYLANWLRDHEKLTANAPASGDLITSVSPDVPTSVTTVVAEPPGPDFNFWITEANQLMDAEMPDNFGALFCAKKAEATARSDIEWARAKNSLGAAQFRLNNLDESLAAFKEIGRRFNFASEVDKQKWLATALFNEGLTLVHLGRQEEAIAVLDDVLARFDSAPELPLRKQVAETLFNKGVALGQLGRTEEAIAIYDDVITRFDSAPELPLRERVAKAVVNKGAALGQLGRREEAIAIYDDVVARFGSATELPLSKMVTEALTKRKREETSLRRN